MMNVIQIDLQNRLQRRRHLVTAVGAALLLLVLSGWGIYVLLQNQESDSALQKEVDNIRLLAAQGEKEEGEGYFALAVALDASLVSVPAGNFIQGSESGAPDERPQRRVYLEAFEVDRYEVTQAQYQRFLRESEVNPPRYWNGQSNGLIANFPPGTADYPVVGVSWAEARAYCEWSGKRLPTEAEWEKACRGPEGNIYPWGKRWKPNKANLGLEQVSAWPLRIDDGWQFLLMMGKGSEVPSPQPVGSYPEGASFYGVFDLTGNVSEWVEDWYNWEGYACLPERNPVSLGPPWNHGLRGSAWFDRRGIEDLAADLSRCAKRNSSHSADDPRVGFRCARSLP